MCATAGSQAKEDLVERIRSILATRSLSISKVSKHTEALYGCNSECFIPHNFYYDLRSPTFTPSMYQIFALSRISGYRLNDWLRLLGFDVEEILRLQILLSNNRTLLLDASLTDYDSCVRWFRDRTHGRSAPATAPLTELLEFSAPRRLSSLSPMTSESYSYVKVGRQDALAFPDLLPGSIVRINPNVDARSFPRSIGEVSKRIFLVERGNCIYCCQLRLTGDNRFTPAVMYNPYADVDWQVDPLQGIRGTADLEIRPLTNIEPPPMAPVVAEGWTPKPLFSGPKVSRLLRAARAKLGLSLREGSGLSRRIAKLLNDPAYFISASSLSDYEVRDTLPRHIQKLLAVCVIYGLNLSNLLETAGLVLERAGHDAIPDRFMQRAGATGLLCSTEEAPALENAGFFARLLQELRDIPFFLRGSLDSFSGSPSPSLRDFFWVGGEQNAVHPYLENALLVAVNRHRKAPYYSAATPMWQQPVYLLRRRDGTYACGCCGTKNGTLILHSFSDYFHCSTELQNRQDAEVVGQIVGIVRRLA